MSEETVIRLGGASKYQYKARDHDGDLDRQLLGC